MKLHGSVLLGLEKCRRNAFNLSTVNIRKAEHCPSKLCLSQHAEESRFFHESNELHLLTGWLRWLIKGRHQQPILTYFDAIWDLLFPQQLTVERAAKLSKKLPSPCIDVCKFRREGHCIGCSMTKQQKQLSKSVKKPQLQFAFLQLVICQQEQMGKFSHWMPAFQEKLRKKKFRGMAKEITLIQKLLEKDNKAA